MRHFTLIVFVAAFFSLSADVKLVHADCTAAAPCSSSGKVLTFYVPHNVPNCQRSLQGCISTSRPNLNGESLPLCLDDVRTGKSKYVTLASAASNYGKYYNLGKITYKSAEDDKTYTVENVIGYVHDTGCAFNGTCPNSKWGKFSSVPRPDKIDICQTICKKCTSDNQASAYATGGNTNYVPDGKGTADTNNPGSMFAGTGWNGVTNSSPLTSSPFSSVNPLSAQPSTLAPMSSNVAQPLSQQAIPVSQSLSSSFLQPGTTNASTPGGVSSSVGGTAASSLLGFDTTGHATSASSTGTSTLDLLAALANAPSPVAGSQASGTPTTLNPGASVALNGQVPSSPGVYATAQNLPSAGQQTFTSNDLYSPNNNDNVSSAQPRFSIVQSILNNLTTILQSILSTLVPH